MSEEITSNSESSNRLPKRKHEDSYLSAETKKMVRAQRLNEQEGHRKRARVNARAHADEQQNSGPEGELQNKLLEHPWLDRQLFDGVDSPLAVPANNTDARRKFDNERREQEMEKQLRLGNMPNFTSAPKYKPS